MLTRGLGLNCFSVLFFQKLARLTRILNRPPSRIEHKQEKSEKMNKSIVGFSSAYDNLIGNESSITYETHLNPKIVGSSILSAGHLKCHLLNALNEEKDPVFANSPAGQTSIGGIICNSTVVKMVVILG